MCPFLSLDSSGRGYCDMSSRKISAAKTSDVCESSLYEDCPTYTTDRDVERSAGNFSAVGYSRLTDFDSDIEGFGEFDYKDDWD